MIDEFRDIAARNPTSVAPESTLPDVYFALIERAANNGAALEVLNRLLDLQRDARAARNAEQYHAALAAAQADCGGIVRHTTTADAGSYRYRYTPLEDVLSQVGASYTRHGLSWSWRYEFAQDAVIATCMLRHVGGHEETSSFRCPIASGSRSSPQHAVAIARTYATRYSFIAVAGLAVGGEDTDANDEQAAAPAPPADPALREETLKIMRQCASRDELRRAYALLTAEQRGSLQADDITKLKESCSQGEQK